MPSSRAPPILALVLAAFVSLGATSAPGLRLERVVIVMRHGVRPPTKSAQALAPLSDQAWPDETAWGAAPGELTPHGAAAIRLLAQNLRRFYASQGLIAPGGALTGQAWIWADSADERTRATAQAVAEGWSPGAPSPAVGSRQPGEADPLFDSLDLPGCAIDPGQALTAAGAQGPLETPQTTAALARLQAIVAPRACQGGAGTCLSGPSALAAGGREVKISGPLATGAALAEDLLLEYENGLAPSALGWGRLAPGDLAVIMAAHDRASDLTRATPYIAVRRGALMARFIAAALMQQPAPAGAPSPGLGDRLIVLVGHDTNLANLAGLFGLTWTLPGQPDATAPGTALAFERWRDPSTGQAEVRVRVFYQAPDEVRDLTPPRRPPVAATPRLCAVTDGGACRVDRLAKAVTRAIPAACAIGAAR